MRGHPIFVLTLLVGLCSCASSGVHVDSSFDRSADFSRLETYDWLGTPAPAMAHLFDPLESELRAKGLRRSREAPDLLVAVHRSLEGIDSTRGASYSMSGGWLVKHKLQQGTLVVDLVEPASRRGIWRGTASGVFVADMSDMERQQLVRDLLQEMFADFPPKTQ